MPVATRASRRARSRAGAAVALGVEDTGSARAVAPALRRFFWNDLSNSSAA
jgi:hypothetical protein